MISAWLTSRTGDVSRTPCIRSSVCLGHKVPGLMCFQKTFLVACFPGGWLFHQWHYCVWNYHQVWKYRTYHSGKYRKIQKLSFCKYRNLCHTALSLWLFRDQRFSAIFRTLSEKTFRKRLGLIVNSTIGLCDWADPDCNQPGIYRGKSSTRQHVQASRPFLWTSTWLLFWYWIPSWLESYSLRLILEP